MFSRDSEISLHIEDGKDFIIDERANQFIALRKLSWSEGKDPKWDIRKWISKPDGTEQAMKGTSFLTEDGPHNLTKVLCEQGFGKTYDIVNGIKDRPDFRHSLNRVLGSDDEFYDETATGEEYYDPCAMLDDLCNVEEE